MREIRLHRHLHHLWKYRASCPSDVLRYSQQYQVSRRYSDSAPNSRCHDKRMIEVVRRMSNEGSGHRRQWVSWVSCSCRWWPLAVHCHSRSITGQGSIRLSRNLYLCVKFKNEYLETGFIVRHIQSICKYMYIPRSCELLWRYVTISWFSSMDSSSTSAAPSRWQCLLAAFQSSSRPALLAKK